MTREGVRFSNPSHRPDQALGDLYDLMNDQSIKLQERIFAARSASRIEPLGLTGDEPPAVARIHGKPYSAVFRHQAASALAYWERRAKQAAIKFAVTDNTEQIIAWRRITNGTIRYAISKIHRWPQDKHDLIAPNDSEFNRPAYDPELALNAIFLPAEHTKKRRAKAIDEPDKPTINSEKQRQDILAAVAATQDERANPTAQHIAEDPLNAG
jgi:hypothetical protein